MSDLEDILSTAQSAVAGAGDSSALDDVRVKYLGKKGELTGLLKGLGKLSPEERPAAGAEINTAKEALQESISARKADLDNAAINAQLASETIDVTLPGRNSDNRSSDSSDKGAPPKRCRRRRRPARASLLSIF